MTNATRTRRKVWAIAALAAVAAIGYIGWILQPSLAIEESQVLDHDNRVAGKVYRILGSDYLVELDSGAALLIDHSTIKLIPKSGPVAGISVGRYKIVSKRSLVGVDLTNSESFNHQTPVIRDGRVFFFNPMTPGGGELSFPAKK